MVVKRKFSCFAACVSVLFCVSIVEQRGWWWGGFVCGSRLCGYYIQYSLHCETVDKVQ